MTEIQNCKSNTNPPISNSKIPMPVTQRAATAVQAQKVYVCFASLVMLLLSRFFLLPVELIFVSSLLSFPTLLSGNISDSGTVDCGSGGGSGGRPE
jgi:hypothetical protein